MGRCVPPHARRPSPSRGRPPWALLARLGGLVPGVARGRPQALEGPAARGAPGLRKALSNPPSFPANAGIQGPPNLEFTSVLARRCTPGRCTPGRLFQRFLRSAAHAPCAVGVWRTQEPARQSARMYTVSVTMLIVIYPRLRDQQHPNCGRSGHINDSTRLDRCGPSGFSQG